MYSIYTCPYLTLAVATLSIDATHKCTVHISSLIEFSLMIFRPFWVKGPNNM